MHITSRLKRLALAIMALITLAGCSNSPVFINPMYNRLDDQIMASFERLTEFNEAQSAEFSLIADNFHYWHRRDELPRYATLLDSVQKSIRSRKGATREDVAQWLKTSESFTRAFRGCHPINFSNNIIRSLSDEQLAQIKVNRSSRQAGYRKKYFDEDPQARIERRSANIIKWVSRTGLQLNDKQKAMLRKTLTKQISLRKQYFHLSQDWNERLYPILEDRRSPDLDARLVQHLDELWHLLERAHPEQWRQNRELWTDFILELVQSFTSEQRTYTSSWIRKMGKTLSNVSRRGSNPNPDRQTSQADSDGTQSSAQFGCSPKPAGGRG